MQVTGPLLECGTEVSENLGTLAKALNRRILRRFKVEGFEFRDCLKHAKLLTLWYFKDHGTW